jgi:hypothetical protein
MSMAECARKWYFREGDGCGRREEGLDGTWRGVEGGFGKVLR